MPSLQENKRRSNKDLAVVRLRVSPPIGRLWDGAVTASNIAPNIATTKTRRAPCVLFATYRPHSRGENVDSIVPRPFPEYYPRIGERNASGIAALGS